MQNIGDQAFEINEYFKEYLRYIGLHSTLECFEADVKVKLTQQKVLKQQQQQGQQQQQKKENLEDLPRICQLLSQDSGKTKRELNLEKELKAQNKKYQQILQAGRQIFSVSINLLQMLHSFRESQQASETLENYKIQLGKYHKIIINEGKPEGNELITETVMQEHKTKLINHYQQQNVDGMIEVLLSLRVNALQIAPELRKNLVYELIRNDIFNIEATENFEFILTMLDFNNQSLKHAICSLVSVISSTLRGVEYLCHGNNNIVIENIIKILKDQENGTVTQRFCLAILQKCSIKESVVPTLVKMDLINWTLNLIKLSLNNKIHVFCLDFASAMLANITHTPSTLQYFEQNPQFTLRIMEQMLAFIKENIPVSVLMHILISLSYLSKETFSQQMEECQFVDKISEFVEYYSQINTAENEAAEIDKKTVLDLCAHMFHPKDTSLDHSTTLELNELKTEDRIREYENEQGELIFECFQDEVS
ncbi:Armadillo-type fold [Pseudocohnilembus persalinus]|uniref:Armadillo-type fold n=1 Tax=Pseudocohnilembus persalinus TaxID=266149 RepID=A0A0V0R1B1_PSEPJ|nr:Armadillo-type fold [Pseudocohnilembus persalinus]|eukprot:KRX08064.1 Armadillo-type fold [Pseudocohnilembus persalinus]